MRKPNKNLKKKTNNYIRFSGLAFQMMAVIGIGVWGGVKLDEKTGNEKPIYTLIFTLLGVLIAMYQAIKEASK